MRSPPPGPGRGCRPRAAGRRARRRGGALAYARRGVRAEGGLREPAHQTWVLSGSSSAPRPSRSARWVLGRHRAASQASGRTRRPPHQGSHPVKLEDTSRRAGERPAGVTRPEPGPGRRRPGPHPAAQHQWGVQLYARPSDDGSRGQVEPAAGYDHGGLHVVDADVAASPPPQLASHPPPVCARDEISVGSDPPSSIPRPGRAAALAPSQLSPPPRSPRQQAAPTPAPAPSHRRPAPGGAAPPASATPPP